jgi:crotonobetainyl-CoA:carnitine CoA-transferase CaiB-like acyl-CoA transferase
MWAVQGILAELYERQRTGKSRLVECSLLETAIGFSSWTSAQWLADHEEPTRQGSRHRQNAPHQRTQTKDGSSDGGRRRRGDLGPLCQGFGAAGMVRGPAFCDRSAAPVASLLTSS